MMADVGTVILQRINRNTGKIHQSHKVQISLQNILETIVSKSNAGYLALQMYETNTHAQYG